MRANRCTHGESSSRKIGEEEKYRHETEESRSEEEEDESSEGQETIYTSASRSRRQAQLQSRHGVRQRCAACTRFLSCCWDSRWWTSSATKVNLSTQGCVPLAATAPSLCTWQDREPHSPARAYVCTLRFGNSTTFVASCRRSTFTLRKCHA